MDIGRMNKRISVYGYVDEMNELKQSRKVMKKIKTVWASFNPVRGREYYDAQKLREEVTYKCYIRYMPGITADMYLKYKNVTYNITSVINVNNEDKMLEIYCVENVKKIRQVKSDA